MSKNFSWSHSSLKQYETCPRQYHEVKVLKKYPFEQNEAAKYGDQLHEAIEFYIKDGTPLPEHFAFVQPVVDNLIAKPGRKLAEYEMALTKELRPSDWKSRDTWVRGVADVLIVNDDNLTATVVDWKSGSNKYPDQDQLVLMALLVFAHFPHVRKVNAALVFLLKNDMVTAKIEREQAAEYWWKYRERLARIESSIYHNVWNPKQSGLCKKYCPVTTCEFNGNH